MKKRIGIYIITVVMAATLLSPQRIESIVTNAVKTTINAPVTVSSGKPSDSTYEMKVAENDNFELMAHSDGRIGVKNKKTQEVYHSNPIEEDAIATGINMTNMKSQLYVTWADESGNTTTKNSTTDCVNKGWLTYELTENGIRFNYDFQAAGIVIPVQYTLEEDGFRAKILIQEIVEGEQGFVLTDISLLPFFNAADGTSSGYTFVPDGSGALIYHNNDKASYGAYKQDIYGRDTALITEKLGMATERARLPVFGLKNGDSGFLAIIEEGDTNGTINAMTGGTIMSYNNVYTIFRYRPFTKTTFLEGNIYAGNGAGGDTTINVTLSPVLPKGENFTIYYKLLHKADLSYVDMAYTYREYLIEAGLEKRIEEGSVPMYINLLGGIVVDEYILGIKLPVLEELTTFSQAKEIIEKLQAGGIDSLAVKYEGWQPGGLESKIPATIKFEKKLGGKKGYEKLIKFTDENNIKVFMDFDFVNLHKGGNKISSFTDTTQTVGSTPAYQYTYDYNLLTKKNQNKWKIVTPTKIEAAVKGMLDKKSLLKTDNIALSTLGSKIYSDFTHKPNGIDRSDAKNIWNQVFALSSQEFIRIMVEGGNAYVFPYVSHIYNAPISSSRFDIADEEIPFYQVVLHGYISYSTEPINLHENPGDLVLKAVETGSSLSANLMYAQNEVLSDTNYNYIFSGNYEVWLNTLCQYYGRVSQVLNEVAPYTIIGHEKVLNHVYKTTYENGTVVYVNYNKKDAVVHGITVPAKDFVYLGEGAA